MLLLYIAMRRLLPFAGILNERPLFRVDQLKAVAPFSANVCCYACRRCREYGGMRWVQMVASITFARVLLMFFEV